MEPTAKLGADTVTLESALAAQDWGELKHFLVGDRGAKLRVLEDGVLCLGIAQRLAAAAAAAAASIDETASWDGLASSSSRTEEGLQDALAVVSLIATAGRIGLRALEVTGINDSLTKLVAQRPQTTLRDPRLLRAVASILQSESEAFWQGDENDEKPLPSRPNMPPLDLPTPDMVPDWIAQSHVPRRSLSTQLLSLETEPIFAHEFAVGLGEDRTNTLLIAALLIKAYHQQIGLAATPSEAWRSPLSKNLAQLAIALAQDKSASRKVRLAALRYIAACSEPQQGEEVGVPPRSLWLLRKQDVRGILDILDDYDDLEVVVYAAKALSHSIIATRPQSKTGSRAPHPPPPPPAAALAPASESTVLERSVINALVRIWRTYPDRQNARAEALRTFAHLVASDERSLVVAESCDATRHLSSLLNSSLTKDWEETPNRAQERLLEGCLLALAGFAMQSDLVRTALIRASVLPTIAQSLSHPHSFRVRSAACQAARAFSRSTGMLRTALVDAGLIGPLVARLQDQSVEVKSKATMAICNFVLELNPMRKEILDKNLIAILAQHTRHSNAELRLNAIWALKNLAYNAERTVKENIMGELGWPHLVALCRAESSAVTMEQALHLFRNICSQDNKNVEFVFEGVGAEALMDLLEEEMGTGIEPVVVQAIWIVTNIAAGDRVHKLTVLQRLNIMHGVLSFTHHPNDEIRKASVWVVLNLLWESSPESSLFLPPSPRGPDPDSDPMKEDHDPGPRRQSALADVDEDDRPASLGRHIIKRLHHLGFHARLKEMVDDPSLDVRERVSDALDHMDTWRE